MTHEPPEEPPPSIYTRLDGSPLPRPVAPPTAPPLPSSSGWPSPTQAPQHAQPLAGHAVYGMAKAALQMLTKSLALDLAPAVRVNAIAPGAILWPESADGAGKDAAAQQALLGRTPLGRTGTPDEIAGVAAWLLSDASAYVTGQTLRVDGGRGIG